MVVQQLSKEDLLLHLRASLNLPRATAAPVDETLCAALIRRAASILCPCSPSTLVNASLEALTGLLDDESGLQSQLNAASDRLLVTGDLLELSQVSTDDPNVKSTWVFAAPPSFVERSDGCLILLGIVPDQEAPLLPSLSERVVNEGAMRILMPEEGENARGILRELGWLELSRATWLRSPKAEPAPQFKERILRRLHEQSACGAIADLEIVDPHSDPLYYASRWTLPGKRSGVYVARRPRAYGSAIWGIVQLSDGEPTKFLDLPLKGSRWRGCDAAWHFQMAVDVGRGTPQCYRCHTAPGGMYLDFFSPLPLWAERRLTLLGSSAPRHQSLLTYWLPQHEVDTEKVFLEEQLWLKRIERWQ